MSTYISCFIVLSVMLYYSENKSMLNVNVFVHVTERAEECVWRSHPRRTGAPRATEEEKMCAFVGHTVHPPQPHTHLFPDSWWTEIHKWLLCCHGYVSRHLSTTTQNKDSTCDMNKFFSFQWWYLVVCGAKDIRESASNIVSDTSWICWNAVSLGGKWLGFSRLL